MSFKYYFYSCIIMFASVFPFSNLCTAGSLFLAHDSQKQTMYILEKSSVAGFQYSLYKKDFAGTEVTPIKQWYKESGDLHKFTGFVWDPIHKRLLIADQEQREILAIYPYVDKTQILSSDNKGIGPKFFDLGKIAIDLISQRLLAIDQSLEGSEPSRMVTAINLTNGDREVLASGDVGSGVIKHATDIQFDNLYNRAYLSFGRGVMALDLYSGYRFILTESAPALGGSAALFQSAELALATNSTDLLITDPLMRSIVAVDTSTGIRREISNPKVGSGPSFCWIKSPVVIGQNIIVADTGQNGVFTVHLESGNRALLPLSKPLSLCNFNNSFRNRKSIAAELASLTAPEGVKTTTTVAKLSRSEQEERLFLAISSLFWSVAIVAFGPPLLIFTSFWLLFFSTSLPTLLQNISAFVRAILIVPFSYFFGFFYILSGVLAILMILSDGA